VNQRGLPLAPRPPQTSGEPPRPSDASLRGLDWFIFFLADVQTGFGPFVAVYLTSQQWTQVDIGLVLSMGGIIALIGQMPGGALVDAARSERLVAAFALGGIGAAALSYALFPVFPVIATAAALHAAASCVLGPCIVAMSLGLVGHAAIGERLGRNARFASIGNGIAAAVMGGVGYLLSPRWVFVVTALLLVPAVIALSRIRPAEVDPERAHGGPIETGASANLCVVDPRTTWVVDPALMASRSRNTPFAGRRLTGRVRHTVYRGEPVVIDGEAQR